MGQLSSKLQQQGQRCAFPGRSLLKCVKIATGVLKLSHLISDGDSRHTCGIRGVF